VRYYTTNPMNGGITFKCIVCGHTISTLDFNGARGNRRTLAAAAINQHAAGLHLSQQILASPKSGSRGAL